jgi:pimeloyl-ACP methyl ester carboxylesterase
MPYARRDNLSLYYERAGSGSPPVVFVHGWCCDHTFFAPQYDHFGASHAVMTYDLRGCGRSDRTADGYDVPDLADDLAWLCEELGICGAVVIGHSLGGMIAIELAARYPGLARAVISDDPGPIDPLPETRRIYEKFIADMAGPDGEAARRDWVEGSAEPTEGDELRRRIVETMCAVPLDIAAAVIRGAMAWDGVAALTACKVPTLVLRSNLAGSNAAPRLLAHNADLHFGVTVGSGHFHQLDAADQVTPMMERFIRVAVPRG